MAQSFDPSSEADHNSVNTPVRRRRLGLFFAKLSAGALLLVLGIGVLHMPWAHPLLMKLAGVVGCPMGSATAAEVDAVRRDAIARDLGVVNAPARPAFGFALGSTTLAEVRAWQHQHDLSCDEAREGSFVKCRNVLAAHIDRDPSFGSLNEVAFGFSKSGQLNAITILRSGLHSEAAMRLGQAVAIDNRIALGSPSSSAGAFTTRAKTATAAWRFADYSADITVAHVPGSGSVLREQRLATKWD